MTNEPKGIPDLQLPEKESFTIQEIAERWRCTPETVLAYFVEGRLVPSIRVYDKLLEEYEGRLPGREVDWCLSDLEHSKDCHATGDVLRSNDLDYIFGYPDQNRYLNENGQEYIRLSECILSPASGSRWWYRVADEEDEQFITSRLLVSLAERNRFEDKYKKPVIFAASQEKPLGIREENSLLRLIGILVRMYIDGKGTQFGTPGMPNADEMEMAVLAFVEKAKGALNTTSPAPSQNNTFGNNNKDKLLRLIGLLVRMFLAEQKGMKFWKGGKPNVHQIATAAREHIGKANGALNEIGLSVENIAQKISASLEEEISGNLDEDVAKDLGKIIPSAMNALKKA